MLVAGISSLRDARHRGPIIVDHVRIRLALDDAMDADQTGGRGIGDQQQCYGGHPKLQAGVPRLEDWPVNLVDSLCSPIRQSQSSPRCLEFEIIVFIRILDNGFQVVSNISQLQIVQSLEV